MPRENVTDKGKRLLGEGRLRVIRCGGESHHIVANCRGDSGEVYFLGYDTGKKQWRCTCAEMKGKCSHLAALQLVTARSDV